MVAILSEQPIEDISDDFMFPMSTRLSYAAAAGGGGGADSDMEQSRRDLSPGHGSSLGQGPKPGGRMVRSSSDPSINTQDNVPGIPPYPSPPTYKNQRVSRCHSIVTRRKKSCFRSSCCSRCSSSSNL